MIIEIELMMMLEKLESISRLTNQHVHTELCTGHQIDAHRSFNR
jgi:hypothetical protein